MLTILPCKLVFVLEPQLESTRLSQVPRNLEHENNSPRFKPQSRCRNPPADLFRSFASTPLVTKIIYQAHYAFIPSDKLGPSS